MCGNYACAVTTIDNEDEIPEIWRAEELGKLEGPKAEHPPKDQQNNAESPLRGELGEEVKESCVVEYDDECDERDYCIREDERASAKGDYVSLVDNPERFTGYGGEGARQVWEYIYKENCFAKTLPSSGYGIGVVKPPVPEAAKELLSVMKEHKKQQGGVIDNMEFDDECLEKRVFYRVISGMHASISTHLCWDYLNQSTGKWGPNLACYQSRLATHPERISNIYFNYALLLRAVEKLNNALKTYTFCSGDAVQDRMTRSKLLQLTKTISSGPKIFDESLMFKDPGLSGLKEDFRNRFRNVSRTMDCIGCDKCRLWGKVQTAGYGAALKILFEFDDDHRAVNPPLRRTELVALINTLNRVSHSLSAIRGFNRMVENHQSGRPMNESILYDDEEDDQIPPRKSPEEETIADIFHEEWDRLWHTFGLVITSWVEFPGKAYVHPTLSHALQEALANTA